MPDFKLIGQRLRQVRERLGIDQSQFGISLGLPGRETISRWERALAFPSADILAIMAEKYHVNIHWLLLGHGAAFIAPEQEMMDSLFINPALRIVEEELRNLNISLSDEEANALATLLRAELTKHAHAFANKLITAMIEHNKPERKSEL